MKSLLVLMASDAPSFCYHPSPTGDTSEMAPEVFDRILDWAHRDALMLHLICGPKGLPAYALERLDESLQYVCYLPAGAPSSTPADIPVVRADRPGDIAALSEARHAIGVLRVPRTALELLPAAWEALAQKVYRVVTVLLDLDAYDSAALERYEELLAQMRQRLGAMYLEGREVELSSLSDRMALQAPQHCQAGLDHVTVDPAGELYLCPGFAATGADSIGRLGAPADIPNAYLLRLEHASICALCDAFHCRRCVFVNQRSTLEINTPPWQACRASHREREQSRLLLDQMHQQKLLTALNPIPKADYEDPLELLLDPQRPRLYQAPYYPDDSGPEPPPPLSRSSVQEPAVPEVDEASATAAQSTTNKPGLEQHTAKLTTPPMKEPFKMASNAVGRVTPEERDTIRNLHMRKAGLSELFTTLTKMDAASLDGSPLYDKLITDMGTVSVEFQGWWDRMAESYGWPNEPGKKWRIDFDTCEIFLE